MLISPIVVFKLNSYPLTNLTKMNREPKPFQIGVDTVCFGNKPQHIKKVGKNLPAYQKSLEELLSSPHVESALENISKQTVILKDALLERFKSGELSIVRNVLGGACLVEAVETDKRNSIKKYKENPSASGGYLPYTYHLAALKGLSLQEVAKLRKECPEGKSFVEMLREIPDLPEESTRDSNGVPIVYDNIIDYLEQVDSNVVAKPHELEKLKQCKLSLLGEKIRLQAANSKDVTKNRDALKEDIQQVLLGGAGKDCEITVGLSDEAMLEALAEYVEKRGNSLFLNEEADPILYMGLIDIIEKGELSEESEKVAIYNLVDMKKRLGLNFEFVAGWAGAKAFYSKFLKYFSDEQAYEFLKYQEKPEVNTKLQTISYNSAIKVLNKYLSEEEKVYEDLTSDELKLAYRKLMLRYHPDINSDMGARDIFNEINQAYEKLKGDM